MTAKLASCPRCRKPFMRGEVPVCPACEAEEEADYRRIGDLLNRRPGLNAAELASEADVPIECVMRMLQGGRIESTSLSATAPCGRCGAPAISSAQRLCHACLTKLNQECQDAKTAIQKALAMRQSSIHEVRRYVDIKRGRETDSS